MAITFVKYVEPRAGRKFIAARCDENHSLPCRVSTLQKRGVRGVFIKSVCRGWMWVLFFRLVLYKANHGASVGVQTGTATHVVYSTVHGTTAIQHCAGKTPTLLFMPVLLVVISERCNTE